jgi:hypothetical protein
MKIVVTSIVGTSSGECSRLMTVSLFSLVSSCSLGIPCSRFRMTGVFQLHNSETDITQAMERVMITSSTSHGTLSHIECEL